MKHGLTLTMAILLGTGLGGVAFAQTTPGTNPGAINSGVAPGTTSGPTMPGATQPGSTVGTPGTTGPGSMTTPSYNSQAANVNPKTIKQAQRELKSDGLYKGAIDGRMGPEMRTAVRHYQEENGLKTTAMLDEETLQSLLHHQTNGYNQSRG
jgi:peptidoglycan hydrolase-like protein with peptidoglycan-binding domain